jgi:hypothetical protein
MRNINLSGFINFDIEKAGEPVGTIKEWGGKKFQKRADGKWRPVGKGHQPGSPEEGKEKKGPKEDEPTGGKRFPKEDGKKKKVVKPEEDEKSSSDDKYTDNSDDVAEEMEGKEGQEKEEDSREVKMEKLSSLIKLGVTDVKTLIKVTALNYSDVSMELKKLGHKVDPEKAKAVNEKVKEDIDDGRIPLSDIPVQERWGAYSSFMGLVIGGYRKALIAYGKGGVGKTFDMLKIMNSHAINEQGQIRLLGPGEEPNPDKERRLEKFNAELDPSPEEYDWVKVTGKSTAAGLYAKLFEHNGKIVVFDDCDSVFDDDNAINILKGALDTSGDGQIDWSSNVRLKIGSGEDAKPIPNSFKFTGRVIFITNIPYEKMMSDKLQPLAGSRAMQINLTMNMDQTLEKLDSIKDKVPFQNNLTGEPIDVSLEDRKAAVDFLREYKDYLNIDQVNGRTLGIIAVIKKNADALGLNWKNQARMQMNLYAGSPSQDHNSKSKKK